MSESRTFRPHTRVNLDAPYTLMPYHGNRIPEEQYEVRPVGWVVFRYPPLDEFARWSTWGWGALSLCPTGALLAALLLHRLPRSVALQRIGELMVSRDPAGRAALARRLHEEAPRWAARDRQREQEVAS